MPEKISIFSFGLGVEASEVSPEVLGGKGAGLVWMDKSGFPVPPGFIIPTSVCMEYLKAPQATIKLVAEAIKPWVKSLSEKFGYMPLVSVRSGARVSMPGMMDTILNVGLDPSNMGAWESRIGKACVENSRKRLIEMFANVVKGIPREKFEGVAASKAETIYAKATGLPFPVAESQLLESIEAVFKSWNNERAKVYRKLNNIPNDWGTAVIVQAMVFGNMNDKSCTGVLFTRHPDTGENEVYGEFLVNAQGEDVVAGIRTPSKLSELAKWNQAISDELMAAVEKLEELKKDVQDVEFTVQNGKLFILQTRNAKRSAIASIRIAVEMLEEGTLDSSEAFLRVKFSEYLKVKSDILDPTFKVAPLITGIPACSGLASGKVVLSSEAAVASKEPSILVTLETSPDDIAGMVAAKGVVTMTGGATSHAAVVARSMNKACIVGVNPSDPHTALATFQALEGKVVSIDGSTGKVWEGEVPVVSGASNPHFKRLTEYMVKEACCGVIGETEGDILDLSSYINNAFAAGKILGEVLKSRPSVIVDISQPDGPAHKAFAEMFGEPFDEASFAESLALMVGFDKVKFIVSPGVVLDKSLQAIARVSSPEEFVTTEGDFVLETPSAPWVDKLVEWKEKLENAKPIRLGKTNVKGGFASTLQIAKMLLKH